ncbi:unnamed protein product [Acanthosepion pharaonis]|uniref:Uncharacterized protein n=1 Tax=Acanthosepion pharaonis TaxID=158019 RepID=A0A812BP67_ACAPH|nr:unnamed protein product [Sepia pharaonis]
MASYFTFRRGPPTLQRFSSASTMTLYSHLRQDNCKIQTHSACQNIFLLLLPLLLLLLLYLLLRLFLPFLFFNLLPFSYRLLHFPLLDLLLFIFSSSPTHLLFLIRLFSLFSSSSFSSSSSSSFFFSSSSSSFFFVSSYFLLFLILPSFPSSLSVIHQNIQCKIHA